MDKDTDFSFGERYTNENPDACEVMVMAHELAKHIEETFGYSRKTVCEGLFVATLQMAISRLDDSFFQNPDDTRAFYEWASKYLHHQNQSFFTKEQQDKYEQVCGKNSAFSMPIDFFKSRSN